MSFSRYAEYMDSGVEWLGKVPSNWRMCKVKHISPFFTGWTPPTGRSDYYCGENFWANISDIGPKILCETSKQISESAIHDAQINKTPKGSLLFSFKLSIGQVSFAGVDMYTNEAIASFPPNEFVDLDYAYYAYPVFLVENASTNIYGAKLLNQELIRSADIALPSLMEQKSIASFLNSEISKIDALVSEQERLIKLLKEKCETVILQAVTKGLEPCVKMKDSGIDWLGQVPEHWEVRSISSLSTKITNGFVGPTRDVLVDEGVRYLQSLHIKNNKIKFDQPYHVREEWSIEHKKSILNAGDVLIVQTGDIGQVAVVPQEFSGCNCHALIIVSPVVSVLSGSWLASVLNSEYGYHSLLSIQTGALHPHLNCGNVKFLQIPVPPKNEQDLILQYLTSRTGEFEGLIQEAGFAIELLKERRSALISAAVTGQIDVRNFVPEREAS